MSVSNPGYEAGETFDPGTAIAWASTTVASLEESAEFAGDTALTLAAYESFDHGWGPIDPQVLLLDMVDTLVEKRAPERFERDWFPDQGFLYLAAREAASFDASSQALEDFEGAWGTIDVDNTLSPSELERAVFDGELVEDFEESWGSTDFSLGSVATASFNAGGLSTSTAIPQNFEPFLFRARVRIRASVGSLSLISDAGALTMSVGDAVTFELGDEGGALPEPLAEKTPYIVSLVWIDTFNVAPHTGATSITLSADGLGAVYVVADPGRFWLDEL